MQQQIEIVVIGVGGVGGYFGAKLAQWAENNIQAKVSFVARGNHFQAIANKGLLLNLPSERIHAKPHRLVISLSQLPTPNIVFICTKSYDLDNVVQQLSHIVAENTIIIPLLNGFNIYERIRTKIKYAKILPACAYINGRIVEPGIISIDGTHGKIVLGPDPLFFHSDYSIVKNILLDSGIPFQWSNTPFNEVWKKFIFVASFALVTAAYNASFYEIAHNEALTIELNNVMNELIQLAVLKKIDIPSDIFEWSMKIARSLPEKVTTSFHSDLKKGNKIESDIFVKSVIDEGVKFQTKTDYIQSLWNKIKIEYNIQ